MILTYFIVAGKNEEVKNGDNISILQSSIFEDEIMDTNRNFIEDKTNYSSVEIANNDYFTKIKTNRKRRCFLRAHNQK